MNPTKSKASAKKPRRFHRRLDSVVLRAMRSLRNDGWLVELKIIPPECGWILQGSRSEYDEPCEDKQIGHGKWYGAAMYMRGFRPQSIWAIANTPQEVIRRVTELCKQNRPNETEAAPGRR